MFFSKQEETAQFKNFDFCILFYESKIDDLIYQENFEEWKNRIFPIFAEIIYRVEEIPQNSQNFYIYTLNTSTLFL